MELTFIRHFPTLGNLLHQYIGSTDEAIEESIAKMILENLPFTYPDAEFVVISPMKRCIQTAKMIYPNLTYLSCPEFRECDFGQYECKTYEELKDEKEYQKWIESEGERAFPGGETREKFRKRCVEKMEKLMDYLIKEKFEKVSLIVHGGTIMSLLSAFDKEQRGFYEWQVANGYGYQITVDENLWKSGEKHFQNIRKL